MKGKSFINSSPVANNAEHCGDFKIPKKLTKNIFSTVFVTWINPLLKLGSKRPLDILDLAPVPESFEAAPLTQNLSSAFKFNQTKYSDKLNGQNKPNILLKSLFSVFGVTFFLEALFLIGEFTNMLPPLILKSLVDSYEEDKVPEFILNLKIPYIDNYRNYFIAASVSMFIIQMFTIFSLNTYFLVSRYMGIKIRTSVSGLIYQKSLRLSCAARQKYSSGKIVNLMSVDANRIESAASCIHYMWSGPTIIVLTLLTLYSILGWFSIVGIALLVAFIPIQNKIFSMMSKYRQLATKFSDERIKKMQEAIYGIRVIKFYCWEESILSDLVSIRHQELNSITKIIFVKAFTSLITSAIPTFACILTFVTMAISGNDNLNPSIIVSSLIFFSRLRMPLFLLPMLASFVSDGKVSIKRIEEYMHAEELDFSPETEFLSENSVVIQDGNFDWNSSDMNNDEESGEKDDSEFVHSNPHFNGLHNLNIALPRNKLIAVVGPIGSGKSSLLSALVGEMKSSPSTKVTFCGSVGYSPQQAWIQNATIRENITFGRPFSAKVYHAVLKACALEKDLRLFPDGDQTEIGEKGVNLSGGQKQRINLARLAYSEADIVLMDDPLSAVDAHVGRHLFQNLIRGYLHKKTRILVTHQLHFLKQVDTIILMNNGRVEAIGTFSELNRKNPSFVRLMASLEEEENEIAESPMIEDVNTSPILVNDGAGASSGTLPVMDEYEDTTKSAARLMAREERTYGSVSLSVFLEYIRFAGGYPIAIVVITAALSVQASRFSSDLFATYYYNKKTNAPLMSITKFLLGYLSLGSLVAISGAAFSLVLSIAGLTAGRRLFREATFGVLNAPTVFFDTNPAGRIINRFSKDQDAIDNLLPESLRGVLSTFTVIAFALFMICTSSVYAIALIIPSLFIYYRFQKLYRDTSRELKRIENLSKSPLVAQFSETLTGLTTIRAYGRQQMFTDRNMFLLDNNNQAAFLQTSSERWAANRLEMFGAIFALTALISFSLSKSSPSLMGLIVGYALDISISLNWGIRQVADMESQIVSTERLSHYANNLPREGSTKKLDSQICENQLSPNWPEHGNIKFEGTTLSYREGLPPVLNNINIEIKAGERVGIVGRTGAGKSSILMALFRINELSEGRIIIDDVDLSSISLNRARSPISIIPQDPVIFSGTIRSNLDPFGSYSDSNLWDALERAHLNQAVSGMEGKLDAEVAENGENLSIGQRQLLCLARALLRRNRILVLDEATANIDLETDSLVQKCIRNDFSKCTILTIAHRLNTVIDYDRILVLDAGQVMEYDSPENLLSNPKSYFSQLCAETGESNDRILRSKLKPKN